MHSPHSLPEKSSPRSQALSLRALTAAIALSAVSCASIQTHPVSALAEPITTEMTEGDIDNPVFIALVSIGAEIQAGIDCNPESRSLQHIWETVSTRLHEMNLNHSVSVSLVGPQLTERGYAYVIIDVDGQQAQVFARDKTKADEISKEMQEFCISYIRDRVELVLGGTPATQEKLENILKDQHEILQKHRMIAIIREDNNKSWTISFEGEI